VQRQHPTFPYWAVGCEDRYRAGAQPGQDRSLEQFAFRIPLAVFGALHLSGVEFVMPEVPSYMPWRLFWAYFVGFALLSASLSLATKIQARWSGLLFGIMMFLFAAMSEARAFR
jgi:hypothetical protein